MTEEVTPVEEEKKIVLRKQKIKESDNIRTRKKNNWSRNHKKRRHKSKRWV